MCFFVILYLPLSNKMILERCFLLVLCLLKMHENATEQSCGGSWLSKNGKFSRADVSGLITVDNKSEIKMCLIVLGNSQLQAGIAELLWRDLVKVRKPAPIPIALLFLKLRRITDYIIIFNKHALCMVIFVGL